eukprot:jgi/Mesvir1/12568/Mv05870-RA.1
MAATAGLHFKERIQSYQGMGRGDIEVHMRRLDDPLVEGEGAHRRVVASMAIGADASHAWRVLTNFGEFPAIFQGVIEHVHVEKASSSYDADGKGGLLLVRLDFADAANYTAAADADASGTGAGSPAVSPRPRAGSRPLAYDDDYEQDYNFENGSKGRRGAREVDGPAPEDDDVGGASSLIALGLNPGQEIVFRQVEGAFIMFQGKWVIQRMADPSTAAGAGMTSPSPVPGGGQRVLPPMMMLPPRTLIKFAAEVIMETLPIPEALLEKLIYERLPAILLEIQTRAESLAVEDLLKAAVAARQRGVAPPGAGIPPRMGLDGPLSSSGGGTISPLGSTSPIPRSSSMPMGTRGSATRGGGSSNGSRSASGQRSTAGARELRANMPPDGGMKPGGGDPGADLAPGRVPATGAKGDGTSSRLPTMTDLDQGKEFDGAGFKGEALQGRQGYRGVGSDGLSSGDAMAGGMPPGSNVPGVPATARRMVAPLPPSMGGRAPPRSIPPTLASSSVRGAAEAAALLSVMVTPAATAGTSLSRGLRGTSFLTKRVRAGGGDTDDSGRGGSGRNMWGAGGSIAMAARVGKRGKKPRVPGLLEDARVLQRELLSWVQVGPLPTGAGTFLVNQGVGLETWN